MLLPLLKPYKHRRSWQPPRRQPPSAAGLMLVAVQVLYFDAADGNVRLVFNTTAEHPLASVAGANPAQWTARYDGMLYLGQGVENDGYDGVLLSLGGTGPQAGADELNYAADPGDIADTLGRQLAAITGFPLA